MLSSSYEKIKLEEEAISEILVADTDSESGAEASNVEDKLQEEKEEEEQQQQQWQAYTENEQQAATSSGGFPWKEHKFSSFCPWSKRCDKKWGSTHQQRQLAIACIEVVFHRKFSSAGGTDQCILPATLRQTSWT